MTTIFGTPGNNTLLVEGDDLRGLQGDDTYILTPNLVLPNTTVVITDTEGVNRVQLADGLQIARARFLNNNAVEFLLSNNAIVQVVGADRFLFDVGQNRSAADAEGLTGRTFQQLASDLGITLDGTGSGTRTAPVTIQPGAAPLGGGAGNPNPPGPTPTATFSASATSVSEGGVVTFTVQLSSAATQNTSFTYTVAGSTLNGTTAAGSAADVSTTSGQVTVLQGQTSATFTITAVADALAEAVEGFSVSLLNASNTPVGSATFTVSDAVAGAYSLTEAVDTVGSAQTAGNSVGTSTFGTLNAGDRIVDGSTTDNDTLNAELRGNLDNTVVLTNIETLLFDVLAGRPVLDAANYTGVRFVEQRGAGSLTFTNLQSTATVYRLNGTASNLTLGFDGAAVAGNNDVVTINLTRVTNGTINVGANIETLMLRTTAGETNTLLALAGDPGVGGQLRSVVVTGGSELVLGNVADAQGRRGIQDVTTFDARDTSKATLYAVGAANAAILTGLGADTITYAGGLTEDNFISSGGGNDVLMLLSAANAAATILGTETIRFNALNSSIDLANTTGAVALDFQAGGSLAVLNATAGTSVLTTTSGTIGTITFGYQTSVLNQVLDLNLNRTLTGGALNLTNVADARISVGAIGSNTIGTVTLDGTVSDGSAATTRLSIQTTTPGTSLTLGPIVTALGAESRLTDLTLRATAGAISAAPNGVLLADATNLTNLTIAATGGNVVLGRIGSTNASLALNSVSVEVSAGRTFNAGQANTDDIVVSNAAGIASVSLVANGDIGIAPPSPNGDAFSLVNTNGGFGALTISGAGNVTTTLLALGGKVNTVTSTSTGSVYLQLLNFVAPDTAGTTVSLGNATTNRSNYLDIAGDGRDTVTGGSGIDRIFTEFGDDVISAGGGDDQLDGGAGADTLTGGAGNDRFAIASAAETKNGFFAETNTTAVNIDRITDFTGNNANPGDQILLGGFGPFAAGLTFAPNAAVTLRAVSLGTLVAINTFKELIDGINNNGLITKTGSVAANAEVFNITVSSGSLTGRYLIVNDATAAISVADAFVTITGISGNLNAQDFTFTL